MNRVTLLSLSLSLSLSRARACASRRAAFQKKPSNINHREIDIAARDHGAYRVASHSRTNFPSCLSDIAETTSDVISPKRRGAIRAIRNTRCVPSLYPAMLPVTCPPVPGNSG